MGRISQWGHTRRGHADSRDRHGRSEFRPLRCDHTPTPLSPPPHATPPHSRSTACAPAQSCAAALPRSSPGLRGTHCETEVWMAIEVCAACWGAEPQCVSAAACARSCCLQTQNWHAHLQCGRRCSPADSARSSCDKRGARMLREAGRLAGALVHTAAACTACLRDPTAPQHPQASTSAPMPLRSPSRAQPPCSPTCPSRLLSLHAHLLHMSSSAASWLPLEGNNSA